MNPLTADDFNAFFESLYGHSPFPWQSMLAARVLDPARGDDRWPDLIDLPTASGKTACIDVSVFALAAGVRTPRRTWFVVDRRIVVDEAYERARRIAEALRDAVGQSGVLGRVAGNLLDIGGSRATPLAIGRLRGGVPHDLAWAGNLAQPAVLTSTIDQLGSRLLFRGYGIGAHSQSVHAALAGNDSLIVLDEAHLAAPFLQTVDAVQRFRAAPWSEAAPDTPFKLVVMSATPPEGMSSSGTFPSSAERTAALDHPLLRQRMTAPKTTALVIAAKPKATKGKPVTAVTEDELVLDAAARVRTFVAAGRRRVGVMVNRVATAQLVYQQLLGSGVDAEFKLLTGRLRPLDRDRLLGDLTPKLRSGSNEALERPVVLVTTQCLEVGADFSFDALISECASLDALRQRFGRLARLGTPADAEGVVLIRKADARPEDKLDDDKPLDPIYHNAMARTWNWLTASGVSSIDMGIDALAPRLVELQADRVAMARLLGPTLRAPTLLPAYLDLWSQTTDPRPAVEPDVALFLHGVPPPDERPRVVVQVLWRRDLALAEHADWADLIASLPPLTGETVQVPLTVLQGALGGRSRDDTPDADVEGLSESVPDDRRKRPAEVPVEPFVVWRGRDDCRLRTDWSDIRPDDTFVFPDSSPTFAALLPDVMLPADVYEQAYRLKHGVARRLVRTFEHRGDTPAELDEDALRETLLAEKDEHGVATFAKPIIGRYGPGFCHATARASHEPVDAWDSDDDDNAALYAGLALPLTVHTAQVRRAVDDLVTRLGTPPRLAAALGRAADLHDIGKADERFQVILSAGRRGLGGELLAKSKASARPSKEQTRLLYELAALPRGFRHELLSMQMAELLAADPRDADVRELELHVIGAHHGQCRPFAKVVVDEAKPHATCPSSLGELSITSTQRGERPPHRIDSGVAERFWQLTRRHGWWGLAYLESVLRCADTHASKYAETRGRR